MVMGAEVKVISTGNTEIDKKLGGGIPIGSLVLTEGESDAGKSVVSQHFTYGALTSKLSTVYYTTENTVKSLMSQMSSLDLDVTDYFLCDRLRVYPILSTEDTDSALAFQMLLSHFESLPVDITLTRMRLLPSICAWPRMLNPRPRPWWWSAPPGRPSIKHR